MKRAGNLLLVVLMVCSLACLTNVSAFGITSPYWQERPLEVVPGETVDVYLELQNMLGEEDITVVAEGNFIQVLVNDAAILSYQDIIDPFLQGYFALAGHAGGIGWQDAYFDNVQVQVFVIPTEKTTWGAVKELYR